MKNMKIVSTIVLATILLATQIIAVGAAPARQDITPITGTVESITLETDADTGTTTVLVTLVDELGETQTIRLGLEDATTLGLVVDDQPIDPATLVDPIEIDPALVIPETPDETETEAQHPVGSALSDFFSDLLGVDYDLIMDYHEEGTGFGVIAQALWITNALEGDSDTFIAILEAKQSHDFSAITLEDGSTPQNWGQFRKAILHDREKAKENLGAIMSGRADSEQENVAPGNFQNNGNSDHPGQGNGNNKDKNKDKGNNGNGNGNNKDKGKGNN